MKKLILASLALALFALLLPVTATAQDIYCFECTCADHCNTACRIGAFSSSTCGNAFGICNGGPECGNLASTELDLEAIEAGVEVDAADCNGTQTLAALEPELPAFLQ